ncbi:MAG TPA: hypothetical protein RMH85_30120 [Polyangiaceae bacterium LLY-WYZ-15_(1-7)]|nr:hypothetical protein [Sandaracinus sp.]MBJ73119.1 hypothetical protein [Sandaracinus sp.]HJL04870.1 hypothetical protein [Polyangiaceae bacterium LLY-WYZ-15_(1-7)]HJL12777.1 hypothetical protein [Polyangiaceae bacterium LLY-WYZ-15_(1-7)]HJL47228.1 hypothetical protein [Polyangiaceae bacterium LLY-WYZ-15_(1-7)]
MRRLPTIATLLALLACDGTQDIPERVVPAVLLAEESEGMWLPELPPPLSVEEQEAMLDTFRWEDTEPLPITDEDGNPALHSALVLLRDRDNLEELGLTGVYYDALPLFDEDQAMWEGQVGAIAIPGTERGSFAFAILPAELYNLVRERALEGDPLFDAVILRESPEAYRLPGGSLSYSVLLEEGFTYGRPYADIFEADDEADSRTEGVRGRRSPLIGRIVRSARRIVEGVVTGLRRGAAELREKLAGGGRIVSVRLEVLNASEGFDQDRPIQQAWGERAGSPIWMDGVPIRFAYRGMGIDGARTNENGYVEVEIPKSRHLRIFVKLRNDAALIAPGGLPMVFPAGLWDHRVKIFDSHVDRNGWLPIHARVRDARLHALAQLTDTRRYAMRALEARSDGPFDVVVRRRAPRRALVRMGPGVDAVAPNATTPCLGYYGFGALAFGGGGRGWTTTLANYLKIFSEDDILIPREDARTRQTTTHEYGHYIMCSMLHDNGRIPFARAYGEIWQDQMTGDGGQAGSVGEGWADLITAQVAGGVERFEIAGALPVGDGEFCDSRFTWPSLAWPCLEDNVGARPGAFPSGQVSTYGGDIARERIALVTTTLIDALDGDARRAGVDAPNNGFLWHFPRDLANPDADPVTGSLIGYPREADLTGALAPEVVEFGNHAGDEPVSAPGGVLARTLLRWSEHSRQMTFRAFFTALARALKDTGVSDLEVCELFALHTPDEQCSDLIHDDVVRDGIAPGAPFDLHLRSWVASRTDEQARLLAGWRSLAPLLDGFRLEVDAPSERWREDLSGGSRRRSRAVSVPFDEPLTVSVTGLLDGRESDPARLSIHSAPQPLISVSGEGLPGAVALEWEAVAATEYVVRMTAPVMREVARVSEPFAEIRGLAGDADFTFEVTSVNAVGELSDFPSDPITVRTLPAPEVYVSAMLGDDTDPLAGTPDRPYRTVSAALAAAPRDLPTQVRIHGGTYVEGPLQLDGLEVSVVGGWGVSGSSWTPGDTPTRLRVDFGTRRLPSVRTERFNPAAQPSRAAIELSRGLYVLEGLDIEARGSTGGDCGAVVHATDADLQVRSSELQYRGAAQCRVAIEQLDSEGARTLSVSSSRLVGMALSTRWPSGVVDAVGIATSGIRRATITDSDVAGIYRTGLSGTERVGYVGAWVAEGRVRARISRSLLRAAGAPVSSPGSATHRFGFDYTGTVTALDLPSVEELFADNSSFLTPRGGRHNEALRLRSGAVGGAVLTLVHITASAGDEYTPNVAPFDPRGERGAALSIEGRLRRLLLANSLLVMADYGDWGAAQSVVDLSRLSSAVTQLGSYVRGNAYSFAPEQLTQTLPSGPLVLCEAGGEFANIAFDEMTANQQAPYLCQSGGSVRVGDNLVLFRTSSAATRGRAILLENGSVNGTPVAPSYPDTAPPTRDVLRSGGAPLGPIPEEETRMSQGGSTRYASSPGIGAWLVP